ncbi:ArsR family transcriptional regulator [Rhizobium sp. NTR19]|uniref:ArsR family transcriptional regulator n=1 Tax=Neorhizobium turbinariae TaxID=2937795 RepID=A0ABT0IPZ8_9HYPH|nr:ArsR family transcriptional regulator [Neorhizobium turbinariae]MCK8779948.1 ArsR family transcriptional regulator [Neorhizobium turbinariae]
MTDKVLVIDPIERQDLIKGLASDVRVMMLKLLRTSGPKNVNEIAEELKLPQSTASINLKVLEDCGLIYTEGQRAKKGSQKLCYSAFREILISFSEPVTDRMAEAITVSMPLGLYTEFEVSGPCGMCSRDGVIGLLDVPDTFLDPNRMKAGLLWFNTGFVEYQFPNNTLLKKAKPKAIEFAMELSSEVPGTSANWPSDIFLQVNGTEIGTWTSPGDYGDKRGNFTPDWWKLAGSQYGMLKNWRINGQGSFVDGMKISNVTLDDLHLDQHRSIRMRIGVKDDAEHPGGINIFGSGFGNYGQDIVLRIQV